jgi:hypothetical protein
MGVVKAPLCNLVNRRAVMTSLASAYPGGSAALSRAWETGSPARCQASIPPASTYTEGKPWVRNHSAALPERPSPFQTVTMVPWR